MPESSNRRSSRRRPLSRAGRARMVSVVAAAVVALTVVSVALAKTFTLSVAKHATVTNMSANKTVHEAVVVNGKGFVVYWLTGDGKKDQKCTKANTCWQFWPPVKVASMKKLSKAPGIAGKLGVWKHSGITQVTLGGHPLYTFSLDTKKHVGTGEGIVGFGGTWHAEKAASAKAGSPNKTGQTPSSPMPAPTPSPYPSGW